jgi:hypothetical protein
LGTDFGCLDDFGVVLDDFGIHMGASSFHRAPPFFHWPKKITQSMDHLGMDQYLLIPF